MKPLLLMQSWSESTPIIAHAFDDETAVAVSFFNKDHPLSYCVKSGGLLRGKFESSQQKETRRRRLHFFPPKDSPCQESQPLVETNEHVFLLACPALERSVMV
jgi:hypothetical protein